MPKRKRTDADGKAENASHTTELRRSKRVTRSSTESGETVSDNQVTSTQKSALKSESKPKKTTPKKKKKNSKPYQPDGHKDSPSSPKPSGPKLNEPQPFTLPLKDKPIQCERRLPVEKATNATATSLIFTHGASGDLTNSATQAFASGFAEHFPVILFSGSSNSKGRVNQFETVLEHESIAAVAEGEGEIVLGGRSMGARAAVVCAQRSRAASASASPSISTKARVKALVLVSYPLIGGSKGDVRDQILLDLDEDVDVLFISGEKDSMCDWKMLREVIGKMRAKCWVVEVKGADHGMGLTPKGAVGEVRRFSGRLAAEWVSGRGGDGEGRFCSIWWDKEAGKAESSGWAKEWT